MLRIWLWNDFFRPENLTIFPATTCTGLTEGPGCPPGTPVPGPTAEPASEPAMQAAPDISATWTGEEWIET